MCKPTQDKASENLMYFKKMGKSMKRQSEINSEWNYRERRPTTLPFSNFHINASSFILIKKDHY